MAIDPGYLIDTNILLRISKQDDPNHALIQVALRETDARVQSIERVMVLLLDNEQIYGVWRQLVVRNIVRPQSVHP